MSTFLPKVRIEVAGGRAIFTRVFLDDVELRGVCRVRFDTGADMGGNDTIVTLDIAADVVLDGDAHVVAELRPLRVPS